MVKNIDLSKKNQSYNVSKYCYYVLLIGIFVGILIKFGLWNFSTASLSGDFGQIGWSNDMHNFIAVLIIVGIESCVVVTAALAKIYLSAKNGILLFGNDNDLNKCKKRYPLVALIFAASFAAIITIVASCQAVNLQLRAMP